MHPDERSPFGDRDRRQTVGFAREVLYTVEFGNSAQVAAEVTERLAGGCPDEPEGVSDYAHVGAS